MSVPKIGCACVDITPPNELKDITMRHGDITPSSRSTVDPVIIKMFDVEPGATVQVLDNSANPAATWQKDAFVLPADTAKAFPATGELGLGLKNESALALGFLPDSSTYIFRQVDPAGNIGLETVVKVNRKNDMLYGLNELDGDLGLPAASRYEYVPYRDGKAPVIVEDSISTQRRGKKVAVTIGAVEFGVTVQIINSRTKDEVSPEPSGTKRNADGSLDRSVCAEIVAAHGDALSVVMTDEYGNRSFKHFTVGC